MRLEDLGLIGNCQFSALVDERGERRLVLPAALRLRAGLLDAARPRGRRTVRGRRRPTATPAVQRYLENTNVLETTLRDARAALSASSTSRRASSQYDRIFRPTQLLRIVEPLEGTPRDPRELRAAARLVEGVARAALRARTTFASRASPARCGSRPTSRSRTSAASPSRSPSAGTWCSPGEPPIEEPLPPLCDRFLAETVRYWQRWVKHCNIPPLYQHEVIRSALALKLHCFEDTGAIVAAMTTSIPESPGSGRTWDYRYCWLRDAYYALGAFRLLGHFEEREQLHPVPAQHRGRHAGPGALAALPRRRQLAISRSASSRTGPASTATGPVRVGNGAAQHVAARHLRRDGARADARSSSTSASAPSARRPRSTCSSGWRARRSRSRARPTPASGSTAPSGSRRPSRA